MMKKITVALFVLLSVCSSTAFASVSAGGAVVNHIHQTDGATFIKLGYAMHNPAGCVSNFWYVIPTHAPRHDDYLRMALTALASDKILSIYLHPTECPQNGPKVTGMTINRS